jgi:hypothetical protein
MPLDRQIDRYIIQARVDYIHVDIYTPEKAILRTRTLITLWTMRLCILPNTLQSLASIRLGFHNDVEMSRHLLS